MASDWNKLKQIVADAIECDPDEREAFVRSACGDDAALRREVTDLLALEDSAFAAPPIFDADFLDVSVTQDGVPVNPVDGQPQRIGGYTLKRRIGSGGAGVVYEAVQQQPHRTVALKLLTTGDLSETLLRRFERESDVLAHLHHPGIAHVYEAGVDESGALGVPYIAMELIGNGRTIIDYAREHQFTTEQKLELFIDACRAIRHAHERGVIHRDLKPANILVDENGQPKIIDFGVARILERDTGEDDTDSSAFVSLNTGQGDIVGTLAYMAPEQTRGRSDQIDERADVYALGAVLFELLTLRLPLVLAGLPLDQAIAVIRNRPAARLQRIAPELGTDLDAITAMTLRKVPENRYQSVAAFAADIRRHLDHRPVIARPPSALYHARLFTRRHRAAVVASVFVGLALVIATLVSISFAVGSHRAADSESRQRMIAERVGGYLSSAIMQPDPHQGGAEMTALEILGALLQRLDATPDELPEVEATIRGSTGETYLNQNMIDLALPQLMRASALYEQFDPDGFEHGFVLNSLGLAHFLAGDYDLAERVHRRCVEIMQSQPPGTVDMTIYLGNLAGILIRTQKYAEAESLLRDVIGRLELEHGPSSIFVIVNIRKLVDVYERMGQLLRAEEALRGLLPVVREAMPESHPVLASTIGDLGQVLMASRKYDEAEPLLIERWDLARQHRRGGASDWMYALEDYRDLLIQTGRSGIAADVLDDAVSELIEEAGEDHEQVEPLRAQAAKLRSDDVLQQQ